MLLPCAKNSMKHFYNSISLQVSLLHLKHHGHSYDHTRSIRMKYIAILLPTILSSHSLVKVKNFTKKYMLPITTSSSKGLSIFRPSLRHGHSLKDTAKRFHVRVSIPKPVKIGRASC